MLTYANCLFFIQVEIFMVPCVTGNFGLHPRHFEYSGSRQSTCLGLEYVPWPTFVGSGSKVSLVFKILLCHSGLTCVYATETNLELWALFTPVISVKPFAVVSGHFYTVGHLEIV